MWLGSALCGILSILENRFPPTPPTLKELASSAVEGNSCGEGNGTAGSSSGGLLGQGKGSSAGAVEAGSAADKERAGATSDGDNVGGIAGATTADGERLSGIGGSHRVADAAAVAAAVAAPQGAGHVLEEVRHQVAAEYLPVMADIRDQLIADLVGIEGSEVRRCRGRGIGDGFVAGSMGSEVRGPVAGGRRGGGGRLSGLFLKPDLFLLGCIVGWRGRDMVGIQLASCSGTGASLFVLDDLLSRWCAPSPPSCKRQVRGGVPGNH